MRSLCNQLRSEAAYDWMAPNRERERERAVKLGNIEQVGAGERMRGKCVGGVDWNASSNLVWNIAKVTPVYRG